MSETASLNILEHHSLAAYNTLGVAARARFFCAVSDTASLRKAFENAAEHGLPAVILGGGSNVLFRSDYEGMVIRNEISGIEVVREEADEVWVKAGAGEPWHPFVRHCVDQGWGGIENLSLIPGTVGAAPIQNIGAYGVELDQVFDSLQAMDTATGSLETWNRAACGFGYRDSIFKRELKGRRAITDVTLRLSRAPKLHTSYGAIGSELEARGIQTPGIRDISDIVIAIRNSKLPDSAEMGNAGSFFKNPVVSRKLFEALKAEHPDVPGYPIEEDSTVKVPAGWLIEQAGWKGKRVGNVGTYDQQALVIVNHGGATGREIWDFAMRVQRSVAEQFGIELAPEVNVIS